MDLHTIEMDPAEAEVKYHEYRAAVDQRHDAEDEAIAKGYRELARGNRLISLRKTMRAGGTVPVDFTIWYEGKLHEHQVRVPRLAVIRADAKVVYCDGIRDTGGVTFRMDRWGDSRARRRRVACRIRHSRPSGTAPTRSPRWCPWFRRPASARRADPLPRALRGRVAPRAPEGSGAATSHRR